MAPGQASSHGPSSLWWNIRDFPIPEDMETGEFLHSLRHFLFCTAQGGSVSMHAYDEKPAESSPSSLATQRSLAENGIPLVCCTSDAGLHQRLMLDILFWAVDMRTPAHIFAAFKVSSEMIAILRQLQSRHYTVTVLIAEGNIVAHSGLTTVPWISISRFSHDVTFMTLEEEFRQVPASNISPPIILKYVMDSLKQDMILPSESNVQARLRYAMTKKGLKDIPGWSPTKFIERAIAAGEVVLSQEQGIHILLPKNETGCWPWVDPSSPGDVYEDTTWQAFKEYLHGKGRQAMERSKSRYHAAETLKADGPQALTNLVMGQLIHLIQLSITLKGWLKPHPTKWVPVAVTLGDEDRKSCVVDGYGSEITGRQATPPRKAATNDGKKLQSPRTPFTPRIKPAVPHPRLNPPIKQWDDILNPSTPNGPRSDTTGSATKSSNIANVHARLAEKKLAALLEELLAVQVHGVSFEQLKREYQRRYNKELTAESLGLQTEAELIKNLQIQFRVQSFPGGLTLFFPRFHKENEPSNNSHALYVEAGSPLMKKTGKDVPTASTVPKNMEADLRKLISEVLSTPEHQEGGFQLAFIKGAFFQRFGYKLDHAAAGYPKLKSLLLTMTDICTVAAAPGGHGLIYPAEHQTFGKKNDENREADKKPGGKQLQDIAPQESCSSSAQLDKELTDTAGSDSCSPDVQLEATVLASLRSSRKPKLDESGTGMKGEGSSKGQCLMM